MTSSIQFRALRFNPVENQHMNTEQNSLQPPHQAASHVRGVELDGEAGGFFIPMNNPKIPSFKFERGLEHQVYYDGEGCIIICQFDGHDDNQEIEMPVWRAKQIAEALNKILAAIANQKPEAGTPGDQPA